MTYEIYMEYDSICPCIDCITFPVCKSMMSNNASLYRLIKRCKILKDYLDLMPPEICMYSYGSYREELIDFNFTIKHDEILKIFQIR